MMTKAGASMIHGARQVFADEADHVAKAGFGRLHAEPQEGEAAFHENVLGEGQRHRDDQCRGDIRHDGAEIDA